MSAPFLPAADLTSGTLAHCSSHWQGCRVRVIRIWHGCMQGFASGAKAWDTPSVCWLDDRCEDLSLPCKHLSCVERSWLCRAEHEAHRLSKMTQVIVLLLVSQAWLVLCRLVQPAGSDYYHRRHQLHMHQYFCVYDCALNWLHLHTEGAPCHLWGCAAPQHMTPNVAGLLDKD